GQQAGVIDNPRSAVYASPEVVAGQGYDPVAIDIFSLGALTYALFSGQHPAANVEEMVDKCRAGPGLMISGVMDGAPDSLQLLVQAATDPDPADRPSDVREFLRMLDDVEEELTAPEPEDRKSTRLNSSHVKISYAVFCLKKKTKMSTNNPV